VGCDRGHFKFLISKVLATDLCEGNYFEDVKQEKLHFIVQKGLIIRYCERRGFLATHGVRKRIFIGIVINCQLMDSSVRQSTPKRYHRLSLSRSAQLCEDSYFRDNKSGCCPFQHQSKGIVRI